MSTLFLLAHQDDEIGVPHTIRACVRAGEKADCAYLTDGAYAGVSTRTRNGESLRALAALGVPKAQVHFLGEEVGIGDGKLPEQLGRAYAAVLDLVERRGPYDRIVTHAWELGHHDHDAAHLVGRAVAAKLGVFAASRQFALYRPGRREGDVRFCALDPEHGPIETMVIPFADRLVYAGMPRHYPSQWRVMLRLGGSILRHYLLGARQYLQHLPPGRFLAVTPGVLPSYDTWGLYSFDRFSTHAKAFAIEHRLTAAFAVEGWSGRARV